MKKIIGVLLVLLLISAVGLAFAEEGVKIDWARFPDDTLRIEVLKYDADHDGILSPEEAEKITEIDVRQKEVETLRGIEYLTGLRELECYGNRLTELDVSRNLKLEILSCGGNELRELDVNQNTELTGIFCTENKLAALDVSRNLKLERLYCWENELTKLDVSSNTKLKYLSCGLNQLTELDISRNTELEVLSCGDNQITELAISELKELTELSITGCKVGKLDLSICPELKELYCSRCGLTELDVSNNPKLRWLRCYGNELTTLNLSLNPELECLHCGGNQLITLDLRHNPELQELDCQENQLTTLDLSHNPELQELDCQENQLTTLDLSHNPELQELDCRENQLTLLDVSCCPVLAKTVRENKAKNGINNWLRWSIWSEDEGLSVLLEINKDVEVYTGTAETENSGENTATEEYNHQVIWDSYVGYKYDLSYFFRNWAQKDINAMLGYLIYEQKTGGEQTKALMNTLMENGIPLSYQINRWEGTDGDDMVTCICTAEMDPGDGKAPRYEQMEIRAELEDGYYKIDLASLMNRKPAEYDPEQETVSLSSDILLAKELYIDFKNEAVPIGVNCEDNGIRMEVISGRVSEDKIALLISMEDMDGKYKDNELVLDRCHTDIGNNLSSHNVFYDRKEHKSYIILSMEIDQSAITEDRMITVSNRSIEVHQALYADLTPYLKQYGVTTDGVKLPNNNFPDVPGMERPKINVLDYTNPLDILLADGVRLTGIGWINDRLHVQIATDRDKAEIAFVYDSWNQKEYTQSRMIWDDMPVWQMDSDVYLEGINDCKPEETDKLRLFTATSVRSQYTEGLWEVQFPLSWIYPAVKENVIEIDENFFPDEIFREEVALYDVNGDGKLTETEAEAITSLYLPGMGIKTLKGIEYLTNLTFLDCRDNELTELDVSNNRELSTVLWEGKTN